MSIHIGTSGYSYKFWGPSASDKNIKTDSYYPTTNSKTWLKRYASDLKSLEINCTRYCKLKPSSCVKWAETTPKDFTFTIKAPMYITHNKKLNDFSKWWNDFNPCVKALGKKFKCILFQFPPSFKCTSKNIEKLKTVKEIVPNNIKCAFEFRDLEWFTSNNLTGFFTENFTQVFVVVPEIRHLDTNFGNLPGGIHIGEINPSFIYIRFHGTYNYSCGTYAEQLQEYANIINETKIDNSVVFAYFNNTDSWTMMPFSSNEGDFSDGIPFKRAYTPSAIYDAIMMKSLISNKNDF
jgi:uncharacterized protein YecE (DUF72 family)